MDSASIEQMNKLRKSLGLPLLGTAGSALAETEGPQFQDRPESGSEEEPASTLETREAAGFDNFQRLQDGEKKRLDREERKKTIQRARDAAARFSKLQGKGLGDVDGEGDQDAKSWLRNQKKRQKEIERERARKLEEELREREHLAAIQYTSSDLAGVQVAHEIGDFDNDESEQILTLKDTEIGKDDDSDEQDVLENADITARDKLKDKLDLKKKKAYDVNADDAENKGLLSQYDDRKRKAFTLDGQGNTLEEREAKRLQVGQKLKNTISLDILKMEPISDYQEVQIKRPKKTKKKNIRHREFDNDDGEFLAQDQAPTDAMQVDEVEQPVKPKVRSTDTFNDDEDLASALSFSRRTALKKRKLKTEDLLKQLKEEDESSIAEVDGGLTIDDTTNFLDNIEARPREEQIAVTKRVENPTDHTSPNSKDDSVMEDNQAYTIVEGDEEALLDQLRQQQSRQTSDVPTTGLAEEKTLDQGLGAALSLLRQRGLVKNPDMDGDKNGLYRDRQRFITEARLREHDSEQRARAQRERDRTSGKMAGLSTREREEHARWQNEQRAQQSSVQAAAAFNREYKPDVQIKYVDDDGRLMNQKEAFKHLSHQFHGKGSGKQKTEKHMKKVADEKRREAKHVLDASGDGRGMHGAAGTMGKRDKVAGVRLA